MNRYIGRAIPRVEDWRFLVGRGRYTDDISLADQAYCVFVRSPHAHARIVGMDTSQAAAAPGVLAVLTGADYVADGLSGIAHMPNPADALDVSQRAFTAPPAERIVDLPHWPLATDRARHVGAPVAAVIASTRAAARDAAELVAVDYEPIAAVVSPPEALMKGAPQLSEYAPGNLCFAQTFGDAEEVRRIVAQAPHVIRHEFVQNRIANCQLEPRAALGSFDAASGMHTLISGSQGAFLHKLSLARIFAVDPDRVRVICPDVGGGFGPRTNLYPEQVVVVWAARRLGRPVKWTSDRSESFVSDYQGRDGVMRTALGLDRDGRILAYDVEWLGNVGAHTVTFVAMSNGRRMLPTVYHVPLAHCRVQAVLTNTVPTAPFRGAGRPEATHMIERLLDIAAARLGIDRLEIRRRNLVRKDMLPYRTATGLLYDCGDFVGYMERVLVAADWAGFPARRAEAQARGRLAGIAVANHLECPVGAPVERVNVRVLGDGAIDVICGTQSTGQGHETSFAQIVAEQLGVPLESVRIRYGDTDFVTLGGGTHSDRSTRLAGTLIVQSCGDIIEQGRAAASATLEAAAEDIVYREGAYRVGGTDRAIGLFELARALESREPGAEGEQSLAATRDFKGRIPAYPAGSAVCELEVDPQTGAVEIMRYTTVDDVGQPINPMIVEGQTHGGIVQGIGQALFEGMVLDGESGQVHSGSFMDYGIGHADDVPFFHVEHSEHPTAGNPLRVKGGGEGGVVPAAAVVLNALCDALSQAKVEDLPMPATPQTIWNDLRGQRR
ncbi:MAG: xanthine dehydrogenase [Betaproteobacteria bacterium RIFCSPLOWO2_12_FULL_63_13]|nr:MAG: xanthine dehydrogenase [Betaproteobacteria bacterium RIFCSPLOWO2_12_FULL_63_13]